MRFDPKKNPSHSEQLYVQTHNRVSMYIKLPEFIK